jgi:anti-sigma factor RsiW
VTCRELTAFIADYLSGDLPPDSKIEFERHLDVCPNCVTYLDGYQDTVRLGRHACDDDDAPVPDTVPEALIEAVLSARSKPSQA